MKILIINRETKKDRHMMMTIKMNQKFKTKDDLEMIILKKIIQF